MPKKLSLDVDALSVDSFETAGAGEEGGTVKGREVGCTCYDSCVCRTAPYYCAPGAYTFGSCNYTQNESCTVEPTAWSCDPWETCDWPCAPGV